ncbi:MAG: hypothetical protein EOM51_07190 [Clostridia bacterium]|nr:hypothetical protein [Clostridia bacterium]
MKELFTGAQTKMANLCEMNGLRSLRFIAKEEKTHLMQKIALSKTLKNQHDERKFGSNCIFVHLALENSQTEKTQQRRLYCRNCQMKFKDHQFGGIGIAKTLKLRPTVFLLTSFRLAAKTLNYQ